MNLFLQVVQTMIFSAVIICLVWTATSFSKNNAGYRWRKYLWLLLAVRLIIPFNFALPSYSAPINITIRPVTSMSSNHFVPGSNDLGQMQELPDLSGAVSATDKTDASANEGVINASVDGAAVDGAVNTEAIVNEDTVVNADTVNSAEAAVKTNFIQSAINLLYKAAASKTTGIIVLSVWLSVAAVLGILRVLQYIYARRKYLSCSEVCTDESILAMVEEIRNEYGIKRAPAVLSCSMHTSPILIGYFKTMLIIPELDYTGAELNYILRHEMNHYKSRDLWYKFFMVAICDVYWFNPALRLMKHMAFQDTEFVCDENTTKALSPAGKNAYCTTLLKVMAVASCSNLSFTTQFAGGKKKAMKRFENVFTLHNKKIGFAILSLILVVVVATTACVSIKSENANQPDESTTAENNADEGEADENIVPETQEETDGKTKVCLGLFYPEEETISALKAAFPDYDISLYEDYNIGVVDEVSAENLPTAFMVNYDSYQYNASPEKFADITDMVTNRGYLDNMSETAKDLITDKNGRIVAVPETPYYSLALYCNTELFEAAGIVDENGNAMLPTTWEEVAEAGKTIKEATGKNGFDLYGRGGVCAALIFTNMAWNFGAEDFGEITGEEGSYTANLNSEGAIAAMEYLKALKWQYDALAPITGDEDGYLMIQKVASGEAAMAVEFSDVVKYEDIASDGISPEKLAVTAIPVGSSGKSYTIMEGEKIVFSSTATEAQINAALDCLEFLGYTPVLSDAVKESLSEYADISYLNNAYAFNPLDSFVNSEFASYKYETVASELDFAVSADEPAFKNARPLSNLRTLPSAYGSIYSVTLFETIEKVLKDENADVRAIMDELNEDFNAIIADPNQY